MSGKPPSPGATRLHASAALACLLLAACFGPPKPEARNDYHPEDPLWHEPPEEIPVRGGTGSGSPDGSGWQVLNEPPRASEHYVFEVSPSSGTVAAVDARTLRIQTLRTGDRPQHLTTVPGRDEALVINVGSQDASLITFPLDTVTAVNFNVVRGANAIAVAPDGAHAVVFFDAEQLAQGDEFGDLEAVTVLALPGGEVTAYPVSVGFKPSEVHFADDGTRAFLRTDEGISVLDFDTIEAEQGGIAPTSPFETSTNVFPPQTLAFSDDGRLAVKWAESLPTLQLLDLATGVAKDLDLTSLFLIDSDGNPDTPGTTLPAPVALADLDVSPDGTFALATVQKYRTVLELPLPGAFEDVSTIVKRKIDHGLTDILILPQRSEAIAYAVSKSVEVLSLLDLPLDPLVAPRTVNLRKSIASVVASDDGTTALVIHTKLPGQPDEPGIPIEVRIDRSYGYSLVRPETSDVRLQLTDAPLANVTFVPDSTFLFFTQTSTSTSDYQVHRVRLSNFALEPIIRLDSAPSALGTVASQGNVFVTTAHPDGRLTFIEWASGDVKTVTGFEINSQIRD